jgi:hypothetical protein
MEMRWRRLKMPKDVEGESVSREPFGDDELIEGGIWVWWGVV